MINVHKTRFRSTLHNSIGVSLYPPSVITLEFREGKEKTRKSQVKNKEEKKVQQSFVAPVRRNET